MSLVVVSNVTFGIVVPTLVDVVGIMTLMVESEMFGIVNATDVWEIAERSTEPETSDTWTPPISRLFVFFNN